ncbi:MAG: RidA family protein [Hyphomicrobiales bacterium]
MPKTVVRTKALSYLPHDDYPYSAGTKAPNGMVYTAGLVAWDEKKRLVGLGDVAAQTRQVLKNLKAVLEAAGATPRDVLKCNVYLSDMRYFAAMNKEFKKVFSKDPPARTTVLAVLAEPEMLVEIEAVAYVGEK